MLVGNGIDGGSDGAIDWCGRWLVTALAVGPLGIPRSASAEANGTWSEQAPLPLARAGVGVLWSSGQLGGGATGPTPLDTVEAYTPSTNTWQALAPLSTPREDPSAAVGPDGRVYVSGGYDGNDQGDPYPTASEVYDPGTNTWSSFGPEPGVHFAARAAVGHDGLIYTFGSYIGPDTNATQRYSPITDTWTTDTPMPVATAYAGAATSTTGVIYVVGGFLVGAGDIAAVQAFTPGG